MDTVLSGHNALVLATGERGAGKSHTLFGSHSEPGLCLRVVEAAFARIGQLGGKSDWIVSRISLHFHLIGRLAFLSGKQWGRGSMISSKRVESVGAGR